jgi:hypothetical protein
MKPSHLALVRSTEESKAFTVHQSQSFNKIRALSELTKSLQRQGCLGFLVKEERA